MPSEVDDMLAEAVRHHQAGRLAEARTLYEEILRLDEKNPNALNLLGMIHHAEGRQEHASELIARAIEAAPSIAGFHNNLGTVRLAQRRPTEAEQSLRNAIALQPDYVEAINNLGVALMGQGKMDEAIAELLKAIKLRHAYPAARNNLGNALRGLGNYDAARSHYADSLRAYRNYDDRWAIAFLLEDVGMLSSLIGDARSAFTLMGCADALREAIGTPRSQLLEDELETALATVAENISEGQRSSWRIHGRSLDLQTGIDHALAVCSSDGRTATRETSSARSLNQPNV